MLTTTAHAQHVHLLMHCHSQAAFRSRLSCGRPISAPAWLNACPAEGIQPYLTPVRCSGEAAVGEPDVAVPVPEADVAVAATTPAPHTPRAGAQKFEFQAEVRNATR